MQHDKLSPTGERLIHFAEEISGEPDAENPAPLSEFVQTYREWITVDRGRGTQEEQAERWQLVVQGVISAPDIASAVAMLIRYTKVIWDGQGPVDLRVDGSDAILAFNEPSRPGREGLISAIWPLALNVCLLEFLAGTALTGASGTVTQTKCLPDAVLDLLFGCPIQFGQEGLALVFPKNHLRRPVVARAADLPRFFGELMPLTLGARRGSPSIQSMISGLLRDDKRGPIYRSTSFADVAGKLGMSAATLRRRLGEEGSSFRGIRDRVFNDLARAWLEQADIPVEEIAARLGYSDSYAFRRFFWRMNGCAPTSLRKSGPD